MLALKSVLPTLPMIAALSANHLAALDLPPTLRRLYVALDNDAAGRIAAVRLRERARSRRSRSASSCRCSPTSMSICASSAPRRCSRISSATRPGRPGAVLRRDCRRAARIEPHRRIRRSAGMRNGLSVRRRGLSCRKGPRPWPSRAGDLPEAPGGAVIARSGRRPEPPRNVRRRLFSAAGFHPALQRETK